MMTNTHKKTSLTFSIFTTGHRGGTAAGVNTKPVCPDGHIFRLTENLCPRKGKKK
jgi:hypothetical protein